MQYGANNMRTIVAQQFKEILATDIKQVVFGVTLRLLVIHFVVVFHHQQTRPLTSD